MSEVTKNPPLEMASAICDEAWSFCYAKAKNVPEEKKGTGAGDVWTWVAIDADSKLILSYLCGGRDASWACQFMEDLASRVTTRIQITTDGHRAYAEAVEGAFGMDVDYAMLIKLYGAPTDSPDTRYSPAQCIGIRTGILSGNPNRDHISTSYVERQNLNLRMGVRRFTRLTNAFSKKFENHCHMVAIYHAYYNFCRVHQTLRVTPAMEAGLTDHIWSLEELVCDYWSGGLCWPSHDLKQKNLAVAYCFVYGRGNQLLWATYLPL
jgi:IS1 family transposase